MSHIHPPSTTLSSPSSSSSLHLLETPQHIYLLSPNHTLKIHKFQHTTCIYDVLSTQYTPSGRDQANEHFSMRDSPSQNDTLEMLRSANTILRDHIIYALLGFIRFTRDWYAVIVTKVRDVGVFGIMEILEIEKIRIEGSYEDATMPEQQSSTSSITSWNPLAKLSSSSSAAKKKDAMEKRYLDIFNTLDMSKGFYFSHTYRLNCTLQFNMTHRNSKHDFRRDMFVWNAEMNFLDGWTVPLIHGFCDVTRLNVIGRQVDILIVSRRSRFFAGTRYLKRGLHDSGNVANHVETEQIVIDVSSIRGTEADLNGSFSSFVQVRGSIPTYWSQKISTKVVDPKPDIVLGKFDPLYQGARRHFDGLRERYGSPIMCLDLVKQHEKKPREAPLGRAFEECVDYLNKTSPKESEIEYIAWDFKHATRNKPDVFLNDLTALSEEALESTSFFCNKILGSNGKLSTQYQKGVLRTNCVDCLDRTNIAQFFLAKHALGHQLYEMHVIESPQLILYGPLLESIMMLFQKMGDQIAIQYGGSPTVSAGINHRGFTWDLMTSAKRYYSNNFMDETRQHAMNLFLQNFKYTPNGAHIWEIDTDCYLHPDMNTQAQELTEAESLHEANTVDHSSYPYSHLNQELLVELPTQSEELIIIPHRNTKPIKKFSQGEILRSLEGKLSREHPSECDFEPDVQAETSDYTAVVSALKSPDINFYGKYVNSYAEMRDVPSSSSSLYRDLPTESQENAMRYQHQISTLYNEEENCPFVIYDDQVIYTQYIELPQKFKWKQRNEEYDTLMTPYKKMIEPFQISMRKAVRGTVFNHLTKYFPSCFDNDMISARVEILLERMSQELVLCDRVRHPRLNQKAFNSHTLYELIQGRVYRQCFLGSRAVDWIMRSDVVELKGLSRKTATKLMDLLQEGFVIHRVIHHDQPFKDDFNLYRIEHHNPIRVLNMEQPLSNNCDIPEPCVLSAQILREILALYKSLYPDKKKWPSVRVVPFEEAQTLIQSKAFSTFLSNVAMLRRVDMAALSIDQTKCFFINVFNTLYLHSILIKGSTRIHGNSAYTFFRRMCYNIAGSAFSLMDIRDGILRGNRRFKSAILRPFTDPNDPRLKYSLATPELRVHFICPFSPIMRTPVIGADTVEQDLEQITRKFCAQHISVNTSKRIISLPELFREPEFGIDDLEILRKISTSLLPIGHSISLPIQKILRVVESSSSNRLLTVQYVV